MSEPSKLRIEVFVSLDRAAALRRGFWGPGAGGDRTIISLDPQTLSDDQRAAIAERLTRDGYLAARDPDGNFSNGQRELPVEGHRLRLLVVPEPTVFGIIEAIAEEEAAIAARVAARSEEAEARIAARRTETLAVLADRRTREGAEVVECWVDPRTQERKIGARAPGHVAVRGRSTARFLRPAWPYDVDPDVIESPVAKDWILELTAQREVAVAEATVKAHQLLEERLAGLERLRQWGLTHGSALLQVRIVHENDGAEWVALAREEWADNVLATFADAAMDDDGRDSRIRPHTRASLQELLALDRIRQWAAAVGHAVSADLVCVWSEVNGKEGRVQLLVHLTTPDDGVVTRSLDPSKIEGTQAEGSDVVRY